MDEIYNYQEGPLWVETCVCVCVYAGFHPNFFELSAFTKARLPCSSAVAGVPCGMRDQVVRLYLIRVARQETELGESDNTHTDIWRTLAYQPALQMTPLIYFGLLWSEWLYWRGRHGPLHTDARVKRTA